ncbi:response regulator [Hymenobacter jejuensis]|uniref:Response regulator n=1 Tax=Hymenobacter jejuensis TaxID=2502781 RepID=A0A5B8A4J4_9BACT|nr:response regulator [Hymenobacter jejuensis]QDA61545.1 response regulator [Hymenobacter jejuensis]
MTILVVDDEMDIKLLFEQRFRRELRSGELNLAFCYSGEQALTYLAEHPSQTQLVLSDINMPGMSGLELLRHIREQYQAPPPAVMMLTAYSDEQTRQQALTLGADDLLSKPVDFPALKAKLKNVA